jgi:hypothetical protein
MYKSTVPHYTYDKFRSFLDKTQDYDAVLYKTTHLIQLCVNIGILLSGGSLTKLCQTA